MAVLQSSDHHRTFLIRVVLAVLAIDCFDTLVMFLDRSSSSLRQLMVLIDVCLGELILKSMALVLPVAMEKCVFGSVIK